MSEKNENEVMNRNNEYIHKTDDKYMELNIFVKMHGFAATGGQAKILIRSGAIQLNGEIETRNKKKLYNGDVVEYDGKKFTVKI